MLKLPCLEQPGRRIRRFEVAHQDFQKINLETQIKLERCIGDTLFKAGLIPLRFDADAMAFAQTPEQGRNAPFMLNNWHLMDRNPLRHKANHVSTRALGFRFIMHEGHPLSEDFHRDFASLGFLPSSYGQGQKLCYSFGRELDSPCFIAEYYDSLSEDLLAGA